MSAAGGQTAESARDSGRRTWRDGWRARRSCLLGAGSVGEGHRQRPGHGGDLRARRRHRRRRPQPAGGAGTAKLVKAEGREMIALAGDVTDPADLARIIDEAERVASTASTFSSTMSAAPSPAAGGDFSRAMGRAIPLQRRLCAQFDAHLAPARRNRAAARIVNISSIAGVRHLGHDLAAYAASKARSSNIPKVASVTRRRTSASTRSFPA